MEALAQYMDPLFFYKKVGSVLYRLRHLPSRTLRWLVYGGGTAALVLVPVCYLMLRGKNVNWSGIGYGVISFFIPVIKKLPYGERLAEPLEKIVARCKSVGRLRWTSAASCADCGTGRLSRRHNSHPDENGQPRCDNAPGLRRLESPPP